MGRLRSTSHWSDPRVKPSFGAAQLDLSHPLAAGLFAQFLLNESGGARISSSSTGHLGTLPASGAVWRATADGIGLLFDKTDKVTFTNAAAWNIAPPFSIEVWWNWASGTKNSYSGPFNNRVASQNGFQMTDDGPSSENYTPHLTSVSAAGTETNFKGATLYASPFNRKFLWTYDGTTAVLYSDGVSDGATSGGTSGYTNTGVHLGYGYDLIVGTLVKCTVWRRIVSPGEARWLASEPYAMLAPILRRRYFVLPAVVAPSVGGVFIQEHVGRGVGRGVFAGR